MKQTSKTLPLFGAEIRNPFNTKVHTFIVRAFCAEDAARDIREIAICEFNCFISAERIGKVARFSESFLSGENVTPLPRHSDAWIA